MTLLDKTKFISLLNCNKENFDFSEVNFDELQKQYLNYLKFSTKDFDKIYPTVAPLEMWEMTDFPFPELHPAHKKIIDLVSKYKPNSICEIGAGAGVVTKLLYNAYSDAKYYSVEPNKNHIKLMEENFQSTSEIIKPQIEVDTEIIHAPVQRLPLEDCSVEFVFSCTVMMHIPFLMIPDSVSEISRISSKYVLHVENPNDEINAVVTPHNKLKMNDKSINKLRINYEEMYKSLGFIVEESSSWRDPFADCSYVSYLFKRAI